MTRITVRFPDGYAGLNGRGWDRTSDLPRVNRVPRSPSGATRGRYSAIDPSASRRRAPGSPLVATAVSHESRTRGGGGVLPSANSSLLACVSDRCEPVGGEGALLGGEVRLQLGDPRPPPTISAGVCQRVRASGPRHPAVRMFPNGFQSGRLAPIPNDRSQEKGPPFVYPCGAGRAWGTRGPEFKSRRPERQKGPFRLTTRKRTRSDPLDPAPARSSLARNWRAPKLSLRCLPPRRESIEFVVSSAAGCRGCSAPCRRRPSAGSVRRRRGSRPECPRSGRSTWRFRLGCRGSLAGQ
jgi:hypothetical protein